MKDRFRMRALLAAIVADPYRKLIALALAFGLWFFINSQIRGTVDRTVSLTWAGSTSAGDVQLNQLLVVLPTDRVIGRRFMDGDREIQSATVILRGPRYRIESLDARGGEPLELQITGFTGLDWTNRRDVEFTAADIRPDIRLQGLDIQLEPKRIRLEVERVDVWELPLTTDDVEIDFPDEETQRRVRLDTAEFQPDSARILGPANAINSIRGPGRKPLLARLRRVGSSERQVSATLELAVGRELGLKLAEPTKVTFQLLPVLETFTFELPLMVDDLSLPPAQRGIYRADEPTRLVRIRVGGQLRLHMMAMGPDDRQAWAAANLRLLVVVPRPAAGETMPVELTREARLLVLETAQMTVDPIERLLDEAVAVTLRQKP